MAPAFSRGSASVFGFGFAGVTRSSGSVVYSTPGTFNFTTPLGVASVEITAIGGGGGSGAGIGTSTGRSCCQASSACSGSGGGSGGKGVKSIAVTSGATYKIIVGSGGTLGTVGVNAGDGGQSYFCNASVLVGNGGKGGGTANPPGGAGGTFVGTSGTNGNAGSSGNKSCNVGSWGISVAGASGGASIYSPYGAGAASNSVSAPGGGPGSNFVSGNTGGNGAVILVYNG